MTRSWLRAARPRIVLLGGATLRTILAGVALATAGPGCNTAGSAWMAQPLDSEVTSPPPPSAGETRGETAPRRSTRTQVISEASDADSSASAPSGASGYAQGNAPNPSNARASGTSAATATKLGGKVLGTFKNTYYDFPSEADFDGASIDLMNAACQPIVSVPRKFYESVCVQGSGTLKAGGTVSFAKRDCSCAAECPRTGQRICFDLLDRQQFPWGRGATGKGITPLLTVAVDSTVIPLGTSLYIPEYDGVARDPSGASRHDGCFVAEDRGLAVKGDHVDIFTGQREITQLWNRLVPSNAGVTVIVDSPRCKRAG